MCVTIAACGADNPGPALSITPSGTVEISGPTEFTAVLANTTADVTWSVEGGGTLSNTTGLHVTYVPPAGTSTAMLKASAADLSDEVHIIAGPALLTSETIPGLSAPVSVQYDAQDIPHVQCAVALDCFAVQGFLQAHDRLFPMDFLRHVARSNLAELIGLDGLSQDVQIRTLFVTRAGHRLEEDLARAIDPATREVLTSFVGGINAYLAKLRAMPDAQLPGEYQQLPFPLTPTEIADWTIEDSVAMTRLFQYQLSSSLSAEAEAGQFAAVYGQGSLVDLGKLNAWIRAAAPASEQAHTLAPSPFADASMMAASRAPSIDLSPWQNTLAAAATDAVALRDRLRRAGAAIGSNNWVVAGAKSASGAAMVANDPHLSLQYPPQFHLVALTSATPSDQLNLAGGSFPGLPGAQVGRGAHVGWGVTVVGYDVTDLYLEQFLPQTNCATPAPCVLFKGAPSSTLPVPQTYRVRVGPGAAVVDAATLGLTKPPPPVVLVVPQHGPIIQAPDAAGKAVSVRWTGHEGTTQDLRAFLGLATASDVDAAMTSLKDYATGAQNFVLSDDQGHIAYFPHALIPVRRFADARVTANLIPPWFPLPGDGSAEWGDGTSNCAAATQTPLPASCWLADSVLPQGKDPAKGYYFTANADPTYPSVSDDNNPLAHPPYLSFAWGDSTGFRATRIDELLATAIATNGSVSLEDMEAIQSDHVSRLGRVFTSIIAQIPTDASSQPEVLRAQAMFARWATDGWDCPSGLLGTDPQTSPIDPDPVVMSSSASCLLFHAFMRQLLPRVFADDLAVARLGLDGDAAVKAMIYMLGLDASSPQGAAGTKFCNDVDRQGQLVAAHTCMDQVVIALIAADDMLNAHIGPPSEWVWGRVHTMTPVSQLALVTNGYAPGPFARPGGAFTVDVATPTLSGAPTDFSYVSSGQVRHISVMATASPIVKMQLPGPQRDEPAVFLGPDLLGQWLTNTYFDFAFGAQIERAAVSTQTFTAQ
ncbi:MAG TPA: penicillin acylase family protein [Kofleriaceae bacterium]